VIDMGSRSRMTGVSAGLLTAALAGVGCNLIAGIDQGTLVAEAGTKVGTDAARKDGSAPDARQDATHPRDASGGDAETTGDAGQDTAKPHDAGASDAPVDATKVVLTCHPTGTTGKPQRLISLEHWGDAGGPATFGSNSLFVASSPNGPYVFAQVSTSNNDSTFYVFQIYGDGTGMLTVTGTQLYDVVAHGSVVQMLTSQVPGTQNGLVVVNVPPSLGQPTDAGYTVLASSSNTYNGAQLTLVDASVPFAYFAEESVTNSTARYVFGPGGTSEKVLVEGSRSEPVFDTIWNDPFFSVGPVVVAIVSRADAGADAGPNATPELSALATNVDEPGPAGALHPAQVDAAYQGLVGVHPSSVTPGDVVLIGASTNSMTGPFTLYSATLTLSEFRDVTLGSGPAFTTSVLDSAPVGNGGSAWGGPDTLMLTGGGTTPADGGVDYSIDLLWLRSNASVIARYSYGLPNPVGQAALAFGAGATDTSATFQLAWIEQVFTDAGTVAWDDLWTMGIACP
jgi:hypothetical protein